MIIVLEFVFNNYSIEVSSKDNKTFEGTTTCTMEARNYGASIYEISLHLSWYESVLEVIGIDVKCLTF